MQTPRTMTYAVALAAAAALTLAGCNGGDKDPTSTPTPSASPSVTTPPASTSPSSSPSATATPNPSASVVVPAAARAHTEAGAIAFATFFITEADRAFVTVDSGVVQALSAASCENCKVSVDAVAELKAAQERQVRPSLKIKATNPLPGATADQREVQVQTQDQAVDIVDRSGKVVDTTEAGQSVYRTRLAWVGSGWTMAELVFER
ncbi:DUF6318 family protein [Knoellia sp. LjRoot47]|uniref:DUF6318 family protein n=1 Tax=Knoellia sp. LjRoot47 TaxID=3342330 RepID=UPI003ED03584